MNPEFKRKLRDIAAQAYRHTGLFNRRWARGKLGRDPVFPALIEQQVFRDGSTVLDLGCGRGLLAAWLLAAEQLDAGGRWPAGLARPPHGLRFRGYELMGREAGIGNRALQPRFPGRVELAGGDMREVEIGSPDAVAILDVLHYVDHAAQERLLDRIRAGLPAGGVLVTRVGDAGAGWRFGLSQWVDFCMARVQGHRHPPTWCRPLGAWIETLERRGFTVEASPMSDGTPFANVLLVARVPA